MERIYINFSALSLESNLVSDRCSFKKSSLKHFNIIEQNFTYLKINTFEKKISLYKLNIQIYIDTI